MDDPTQLARDRQELWLSLHVQLGKLITDQDRHLREASRISDDIADIVERIVELLEEMT
jgi:hypothetical protein